MAGGHTDRLAECPGAQSPAADRRRGALHEHGPRVALSGSRDTVALRVRFLGPFAQGAPVRSAMPEELERVLVSPELLRLGLDQTCRIWVRIQANLQQLRSGGAPSDLFLPLESSTARFPDEIVEKTRAAAARIGFTADDESAFYGMELALESFVRIVESSPAAETILRGVVEQPSLWSRLTHLGVDGNVTTSPRDIRPIDPNPWGLPAAAYRLPFGLSLNGQPALDGTLAVTEPRPPLLASAGILGLGGVPAA